MRAKAAFPEIKFNFNVIEKPAAVGLNCFGDDALGIGNRLAGYESTSQAEVVEVIFETNLKRILITFSKPIITDDPKSKVYYLSVRTGLLSRNHSDKSKQLLIRKLFLQNSVSSLRYTIKLLV